MKQYRKLLLILSVIVILAFNYVSALPDGATISTKSNSTKVVGTGTIVNGTGNDTLNPETGGGFIYTINITGTSQNARWKAYVGNVTGTLTLDDADDYTIYDWTITSSLTGEVYSTRTSGTVNWTNIKCGYANTTTAESIIMNHTSNPSDNISATFDGTDNSEFYVGSVLISANTCPTTNLYVNDSAPSNDNFEEVLLYDGAATYNNFTNFSTFGNVVYASIIEEDADGYRGQVNDTYDFQMLLPEIGYSGWDSSTAYYFYIELT